MYNVGLKIHLLEVAMGRGYLLRQKLRRAMRSLCATVDVGPGEVFQSVGLRRKGYFYEGHRGSHGQQRWRWQRGGKKVQQQ